MAIADDFTISTGGNIRHASGSTVYTVLELHQWLQDLADDASVQVSGDNVSILSANPSRLDGPRANNKPMQLNLLNGFNIDDDAAKYLKFGSVQQDGTNVLYTGVQSIGTPLVASSPLYIVQNAAKITSWWGNDHIQVLIKAKASGSLIDSGNIRVYSRKYGQTYSDFAANLSAGSEQPAAITTSLTDWTTLDLTSALALSSKVTITTGSHSKDTGDGNGSKEYKGTITLSDSCTIAEAAQYCQAICNQNSAVTVDSKEGWRFRVLGEGTYGYTPNAAAPFGIVAGGKWFVEQGWYVAGALAGDLQKYQMKSHDGTTITNPAVAGITVGGLTVGARIIVGKDNGSGGFATTQFTLNGATTSDGSTCTVNEAIATDVPATGYIRVNSIPYSYTAVNKTAKTFTISGTWGQVHANASPAWTPYIDKVVASTSESSSSYTYVSDFTARVKVRKGGSPSLKPFETTFLCISSTSNGTNAIADADE